MSRPQSFTGGFAGNGAAHGPPLAAASIDRSAGGSGSAAGTAADQSAARTQGVVEAGVCEIMTGFVRQILGRGPTEVRAFVVEDMLLVRPKGTLTAAEKQLATLIPTEKGRDLVKGVRALLVEGSQCQRRPLPAAAARH